MSLLSASVGFAVSLALVVLGCALWHAATVARDGIRAALVAAESLNALTRLVDVAQLAKALAEASRNRQAATGERWPYDPRVGGGRQLS